MRFKISWAAWVAVLLGLGALALMVFKAATTSFTHDESFSYNHYIDWSFIDIISFRQGYTNLHILNSLSMKYVVMFLGNSELLLRLPNLAMLAVFMVYAYLLLQEAKPVLRVSVFILLISCTVVLDLFGVARGYGLSFGFMLMSLYHFIRSFQSDRVRNTLLFHLGGILAIFSSFVLLDVYVALLLIYNVLVFVECKWIHKTKWRFFAANKVHILPILIGGGLLYEPMRRFTTYSMLDFGGKSGFFGDTMTHLVRATFHGTQLPPLADGFAKVLLTLIVLGSTAIIVRKIIRRDEAFYLRHKGLIVTNLLLLTIAAAMVAQHYLLKSDYPVSRFTLFMWPILILHFGFLMHYLSDRWERAVSAVAVGLALVSITSFAFHLDLRACAEWQDDMETEAMLHRLRDYSLAHDRAGKQLRLGISWFFEPTINFYRRTDDLKWLLPVDRGGIAAQYDYYYVFDQDLDSVPRADCDVVVRYEVIKTTLLHHRK